jgi:hypothetical protein
LMTGLPSRLGGACVGLLLPVPLDGADSVRAG